MFPGDSAAVLTWVVMWPPVFSVPWETKPAPLVGKGQFIDSIKAHVGSQDEIRNLLISPTQTRAAKHTLLSTANVLI